MEHTRFSFQFLEWKYSRDDSAIENLFYVKNHSQVNSAFPLLFHWNSTPRNFEGDLKNIFHNIHNTQLHSGSSTFHCWLNFLKSFASSHAAAPTFLQLNSFTVCTIRVTLRLFPHPVSLGVETAVRIYQTHNQTDARRVWNVLVVMSFLPNIYFRIKPRNCGEHRLLLPLICSSYTQKGYRRISLLGLSPRRRFNWSLTSLTKRLVSSFGVKWHKRVSYSLLAHAQRCPAVSKTESPNLRLFRREPKSLWRATARIAAVVEIITTLAYTHTYTHTYTHVCATYTQVYPRWGSLRGSNSQHSTELRGRQGDAAAIAKPP